ncbi:MAG: nucleotidyltransferase family protein [Bdellovibrionota bacterium]
MKNWRDALVRTDSTVRDVIQNLNTSRIQIALVVDSNETLLGTVVDGDIRRAILKGIPLESNISAIMNKSPKTARTQETREEILAKMKKTKLRHFPIVDEKGRVVGLELLEELMLPAQKNNEVVIMAGGMGSRLGELTAERPKPLLNVGNKPLLETILLSFKQQGFFKFSISVHYKADMIEDHFRDGSDLGVQIKYLREDQKLGTAGALGLIEEKPHLPFVVMNGDLLTKVNFERLLETHEEQKAALTMCVREYDLQVPYGVVRLENQKVVGIDEKPVQRFFVNAGIYVLDPSVLEFIPKNQSLDMPALVETLIKSRLKTVAFPVTEYWLDIGRHSDLERAKDEFLGEFK